MLKFEYRFSDKKKRTMWSELTFSILQITSLQLQIKIANRYLCAICQELLQALWINYLTDHKASINMNFSPVF